MKNLKTGFVIAMLALIPMTTLAEEGLSVKEVNPAEHDYSTECPEPGKLSEVSFSADRTRGRVIELRALNTVTFHAEPSTQVRMRKHGHHGYVVREDHPIDDFIDTAVISVRGTVLLCNRSIYLSVLSGEIEVSGENNHYQFDQKYSFSEYPEAEDTEISLSITQRAFPDKLKNNNERDTIEIAINGPIEFIPVSDNVSPVIELFRIRASLDLDQ